MLMCDIYIYMMTFVETPFKIATIIVNNQLSIRVEWISYSMFT